MLSSNEDPSNKEKVVVPCETLLGEEKLVAEEKKEMSFCLKTGDFGLITFQETETEHVDEPRSIVHAAELKTEPDGVPTGTLVGNVFTGNGVGDFVASTEEGAATVLVVVAVPLRGLQ